MARKLSDATEFQAKLADDNGLTRGKIPAPLLRQMGARPGDYIKFRLDTSGEAVMHLSRSRGARKSAKRSERKASKRV
jgi:hypothetical protein